ncbi:MAG: SHOCT domain-containing protein [Nitriliruptoraceae bacterium]
MMWGFGAGLWWMPLVWLALLGVTVWLVIAISRPTTPRRSDSQALTILEERFARGEIDREEFQSRRDELARR